MKSAAACLALALALLPTPAWAVPSPAPHAAASPTPQVQQDGPGTWDGGVALPLAMTTLGLLSVGSMAFAFSTNSMSGATHQAQLPALAAGGVLAFGATLTPWLLRPHGTPQAQVGPLLTTAAASTALLFAPGVAETISNNNGLVELMAVFGAPLAFGGATGWSLGRLAADAPARGGGPTPKPWQAHALATGSGLATAALGLGLGSYAPQPIQNLGPVLFVLAPTVGLGLGHGSLGDAPRGMWVGASLLGPTLLGASLPLLGSAGITGQAFGGRGRYMGATIGVLGGMAGLLGGLAASAADLQHRAEVRQKP